MELTVAKEVTKTLEVKPPSVKKKKYVRRKVLLLAYARYNHVSMFCITAVIPSDLVPPLLVSCYPLALKLHITMSHCLASDLMAQP